MWFKNWKNHWKKKIRKIKIKEPYWLKNIFIARIEDGKKVKRICEPSKGGIGIKLKTARSMFIKTIKAKNEAKLLGMKG